MFNKYGPNHPIMDMMLQMRPNLKPFPEWSRVSINMPVAWHQESKNIYRALLSYSEQGGNLGEYAWWDTFEINLFLNTPEPTPENPYNWDETFDEIHRFRTDFPHIHINVVARRLPRKYIDIGRIRSIITDLSFFRIGTHPDHIIISHDADQVAIHPHYIKRIIETFKNPDVQILWGKVQEDDITYLNHPDLFIQERFQDFIQSKNKINTPGANSAYRASAYIRVGGYRPVSGKCWEDNDLWQRIFCNSWDKKALWYHGWHGRALRVVTHGRRMVSLLLQHGKIPGNHAWQEIYEDGTSGVASFGPDDVYRNLQVYPDVKLLSAILQDDISWSEFLKNISPHLFKKIGFHTIDSTSLEFAFVEDLAQQLYGHDDGTRSQITQVFSEKIQVAEYNPIHDERLFEQSPLKVSFPMFQFPDNARRAFTFLGVEDIRCDVHFFPDPMRVLVDFQITRAHKMRAGLQKFLENIKAKYQI